ncbi:hypothetical protein [Neptuniibacter sp. QD37_11]|uniref:hypothetical protein n=1 Tax=Neptuniibacter sp. QD37_11 TaxID=3398209 RepID=UPI0039F50401
MTQHNHKLFSAGVRVSIDGRKATLFPLDGTDKMSVNFDDGTSKQVAREFLLNGLINHKVHLIGNNDNGEAIIAAIADESKQDKATKRAAYVNDLRRLKHNRSLNVIAGSIEYTAERLYDSKPPKPSTVYKWLVKADEKGKTANPLIGLAPKPRKRDKRIPESVESLLKLTLERVVLRRKKKSIKHGFRVFQRLCKQHLNIVIKDSQKTLYYNRYNELDPIYRERKRNGAQAANAMARHAHAEMQVGSILEQIQFDAVSLAIGLNDNEGNFIGFPVVHLAIDVYSLAVVGFFIELNSETSNGVIECMKHAFRIKTKEKDHPFTKNNWIMFGNCLFIVTDGGAGYMAEPTAGYLGTIGISRTACKTRTPWHKSNIERLNGTIRTRFADHFGGYIGRRDNPKGCETELKKAACHTLDEFREEFTKYIVDDYNQCPHSTFFGRSPHNVWLKNAEDNPPVEPDNMVIADLLRGKWTDPTYDATNGLRINNVWYNDADGVLHDIYLRNRKKNEAFQFHCLYNNMDISEITVKYGNQLIRVKARRAAQGRIRITEGMSLAEYEAIRKSRKDLADQENEDSDAHVDYGISRELHDLQAEANGAPNPDIPIRQDHRRAEADLDSQNLHQAAAEIAAEKGFIGDTENISDQVVSDSHEVDAFDDNPYADLVIRNKSQSEDE